MNQSKPLIYPLLFDPIFKDYVWGGRRLEELLGRDIPEGVVAESWEIAAHADGSSRVRNGALAGMTLPEVQQKLGVELLGKQNRAHLDRERFPLLIKLLDANRRLSVQVHPDDAYGLANENDLGKTEMWVILHAEPGTELIYGFKPGVSRKLFTQAIENGSVEEWLHRIPVERGDVLYIPAGSIHALGPGALVAEIQQNSNTTYRVYDWGRPRPLHIRQALDVLNFDLVAPGIRSPESVDIDGIIHEPLAHCDYFDTTRLTLTAGSRYHGQCDGETFEILGLLEGTLTLTWDGAPLTINSVEWVLLPASLGKYCVESQTKSTLLRVSTGAVS